MPLSPLQGQETSSIQEFSSNFRSQNLKLIDTPGIGGNVHAHNAIWDAKVLATIKRYLDTDAELKHCIPNVVLIVARFDDEHLTSEEGPFVKSLLAINLLNSRLFDKFSCNVVILLTHFDSGDPEYRRNPRMRQDEVMDLIKNYTQFPQMPYIIFGENNYNVKVARGGKIILPHPDYGGGCYNLGGDPNNNSGDVVNSELLYPSNIIDLIIRISGGSTKGALGPGYFKTIFQHRESIFFWKSHSARLVSSDCKRFRRGFYALKESYKKFEGDDGEKGVEGRDKDQVLRI